MCACVCSMDKVGEIFSLGLPPPPQNLHINIPVLVSASWRDFSFSPFPLHRAYRYDSCSLGKDGQKH